MSIQTLSARKFWYSSLSLIACWVIAAPDAAWSQWDNGILFLASDGSSGDEFSQSVSVSGNVAIAGAWRDDDNGMDSGSAYIFRFDGSTWSEEQKLVPADGSIFDTFGISVGIAGDAAVVGCHLDDDNGTDSGSVVVYRFDGTTWNTEQKLLASDGSAGDKFGYSVAIDGDLIVAGAYGDDASTGSAYIFSHNGSSWIEESKLTAADRESGDWFGVSAAISGDVAVIGAARDDDNGSDAGSAYVFGFDESSWNQESKLLPEDGADGDMFGISCSVAGQVAVVGSWQDDDNGGQSGSAYVFSGANWIMEQKLSPSNGATGDRFGFSVSIDGDRILAGSHLADGALADMGAAYIFEFDGSGWNEQAELHDPSGFLWDKFGNAVSISGETAMVGIVHDDVSGTDSGSVTFFAFAGDDSEPDCNGNSVPDSDDIAGGFSEDCDGNEVPDECDADGDGDGIIDACDGCPNDPEKQQPGVCGCGEPDSDADGDGSADCIDGCPNDPEKQQPGVCGCGEPDEDNNGNGIPDCNEGCPGDGNSDGIVDIDDMLVMLAEWGFNPGSPADIDGNDTVDIDDMLMLLGAWGPCQ